MVSMKDSRVPSEARPDDSSSWLDPMLPLRKCRFARNEQSEKRETNRATHGSLPRIGTLSLRVVAGNLRQENKKEEWSRRAPGDMDGQAREGSG